MSLVQSGKQNTGHAKLGKGKTKMSTLDIIKKTLSEAEGGGTSIEGKKSLDSQKKRAQILLKSADLRLKHQKEREALARQKSAVKEEVVAEGDRPGMKDGRPYSDPLRRHPGNDSYMTPEYLIQKYQDELKKIAAGPYKRPKDVAMYKARIAKLQRQQGVAEGAPIVIALAPIDVRNPKKAPQPQRYMGDIVPPTKPPSTEKRGVKGRPGQRPMPTYEEVEELDELSSKNLSDYSDKASADVHRLDKEGNTNKANKRFDGVVRASDKMTDNGKKLRGTPMKEEEKKMKGEDPCWKGYEMIGKKMKNGKEVPNCVPKEGVKEETIAESGGVKVFKTDAGHIEKYGENNFAVYLDGKKQKAYDSLEAAKKALASGKDQEELDEAKVGDTVSFHHELKAAPGKKVKKSGTVEKVEGDVVHVKVKDKYGVMRHQVKSGDLVKEEVEQVDEASKYQIYHPSYSSAVQHALSQAEKQGFTVDMDDYTQQVAFGPKKPSAGKTNSFSITLMDKSGKISKKKLQMQVYGMEGGKYELNMYTEEVMLEGKEDKIKQLKQDHATAVHWSKNETSPQKREAARQKAEKIKRHLETQYKQGMKEEAEHVEESQAHTAPETVKHYMKGQKTTTGVAKWVAQTIDKKKAEVKEAEEFKQGGKPLEKKFNKAFKDMGVDAKVKMKTTNNVSINEEEKEKPKKSFKDMKKNLEKTSDKDIKSGEKLSGKQEPINLSPTVYNNR
jgi:hypothetical protein